MFSSYDNSNNGFQIDLESTRFHIRKASSSGGNILLSTAELGDWTFIAFTYDGTNSIGYINDNITVSDPGGTTEFNRFRIGRNRNGSVFFSGAIDELRIYNRALTASEISSRFANWILLNIFLVSLLSHLKKSRYFRIPTGLARFLRQYAGLFRWRGGRRAFRASVELWVPASGTRPADGPGVRHAVPRLPLISKKIFVICDIF